MGARVEDPAAILGAFLNVLSGAYVKDGVAEVSPFSLFDYHENKFLQD